MHSRSPPDLQQRSIQIKKGEKFISRLLSKENSMANTSFRVYYGDAAGSVPFMWESQPGTPKNTISNTRLPPLTPPPSYYYNYRKNPTQKQSKSSLFNTLLRRFNTKTHVTPSSSSPSSSASSSLSFYYSLSSTSSSSAPSTPSRPSNLNRRGRFSSSRSSFSSSMGDDEYPTIGSPTSPFCFPVSRGKGGGLRGCCSMVNMKKAILSIAGHGSNQGTTA